MNDAYNRILVAFDGSRLAEKAFYEAVRIASSNQASLTLIAIVNDAELATSAFSFSKLFAQEKERAETEMLKKIQAATEAGVGEVQAFVEVGNPKQIIVKYAADNAVDLLVIGATGKGAITQSLVGSTTAYVVNHAPCNVLVVR
ncbi:universal stress protein [Enterococcus asini]|uniref:universal stress protein n=1 Tax=Enterococcus asini TaxID=57732 RepID=UPI0032E44DDA